MPLPHRRWGAKLRLPMGCHNFYHELGQDNTLHVKRWRAPAIPKEDVATIGRCYEQLCHFFPGETQWSFTACQAAGNFKNPLGPELYHYAAFAVPLEPFWLAETSPLPAFHIVGARPETPHLEIGIIDIEHIKSVPEQTEFPACAAGGKSTGNGKRKKSEALLITLKKPESAAACKSVSIPSKTGSGKGSPPRKSSATRAMPGSGKGNPAGKSGAGLTAPYSSKCRPDARSSSKADKPGSWKVDSPPKSGEKSNAMAAPPRKGGAKMCVAAAAPLAENTTSSSYTSLDLSSSSDEELAKIMRATAKTKPDESETPSASAAATGLAATMRSLGGRGAGKKHF